MTDFANEMLEKFKDRLYEVAKNDLYDFFSSEEESLDNENLFDSVFEVFLEENKDELAEYFAEKLSSKFWDELEKEVKEIHQENVLYDKNPLAFHGLKQSDFL